MVKRLIIVLLGLAVVFGGVLGWQVYAERQLHQRLAAQGQPPVTVSATHAKAEVWHPEYRAVGSLEARHGVDVTSEASGLVVKLNFESGQEVEEGQVLVQLDDAPDRARLQGLQAQAEYARIKLERDQDLLRKHDISQSQYDEDKAALENAVAAVDNQQALIAQKAVKAPFAGRLGIRLVDLGQYIEAGNPLVTLQALNPIYVNFALPQERLAHLAPGLPVEVTVDAYPGKVFKGKVTTISPKVDESTRNIRIQATLDNPQELLRPGMFVAVSVILPERQNVVTLPNTAIMYNPYGDTVFVIEESKGGNGESRLTARSVVVFTGETRGDQVAITKGLKAGDRVVTSGQLKLRNGVPVKINNSITPSDNPAPNLPNT